MMRTIKFRGLDTNGEWVIGDLKQLGSKCFIVPIGGWALQKEYLVKTESVGQFTGQTDKNAQGIYENDIVGYRDDTLGLSKNYRILYVVRYEFGGFIFDPIDPLAEKEPTTLPVTIIGNITDNPELMEGK